MASGDGVGIAGVAVQVIPGQHKAVNLGETADAALNGECHAHCQGGSSYDVELDVASARVEGASLMYGISS